MSRIHIVGAFLLLVGCARGIPTPQAAADLPAFTQRVKEEALNVVLGPDGRHAMIGELDRLLDPGPRKRVAVAPAGAELPPTPPRLQLMRGGLIE